MSLTHTRQQENTVEKSVIENKPITRSRVPSVVPLAFGVYGVLVFVFTMCKGYLSLGGIWNPEAHHQRSLDLVLFSGFVDPSIWWGPWINTLGNIALFFPLGFLLHVVLRRRSRFPLLEAVVYSALTSLAIEVAQFVFSVGYTDVDDLFFNTLGGFLGALFAFVSPRNAVATLCWILIVVCIGTLGLVAYSSLR